ncbi:MAG: hypothetical protein H7Y19_16480, partial [Luteimonas sp.]|nr:hypothetical protein [Luteimonas sp.]
MGGRDRARPGPAPYRTIGTRRQCACRRGRPACGTRLPAYAPDRQPGAISQRTLFGEHAGGAGTGRRTASDRRGRVRRHADDRAGARRADRRSGRRHGSCHVSEDREPVRAFAPASVGNIGVGFDLLGHSIAGPHDIAVVRRIDEPVVRIVSIRGEATGASSLPLAAEQNTAGQALLSLRKDLGLSHGFELELEKGIPLGSGLGGSAASCVAALVAANALLDTPLPREALYP